MKQKKVSVIIPVYNAEGYLTNRIGNLLNQTLDEIELIFVDDASTDYTYSLLELAKIQYPDRVVLLQMKANGGPGAARNLGMSVATGEYIGFCDSDDIVDVTMYEKLYQAAKKTNADIVDSGFYDQKNDNSILFTTEEMCGRLTAKKRNDLIASGGYICTKIFRSDFLKANDFRFREEYVLEDMDYLLRAFALSEIVSHVKEVLYYYIDSDSSLSKTNAYEKYLHSTMSAMKAVYDQLHGIDGYSNFSMSVEYAILQLYSYSINAVLKQYKDTRNKNRALKELQNLKDLKMRMVTGGYENIYVKEKIQDVDIQIMIKNDSSPDDLLELLEVRG